MVDLALKAEDEKIFEPLDFLQNIHFGPRKNCNLGYVVIYLNPKRIATFYNLIHFNQ